MVSFGELESFLAFYVFTSQGKTLISQEFRDRRGGVRRSFRSDLSTGGRRRSGRHSFSAVRCGRQDQSGAFL